jgi:hypothetical protein
MTAPGSNTDSNMAPAQGDHHHAGRVTVTAE